MSLLAPVSEALSAKLGESVHLTPVRSVGGGCINQAQVLRDEQGRSWFLKHNAQSYAEMFSAEAEGLLELAKARAIRVPTPMVTGEAAGQAYLLMEFLELQGRSADAALGEALAHLHQYRAKQFGWHRDNTIGTTAQLNVWQPDWLVFWREQRLQPQLALCARNGAPASLISAVEELCECLSAFFTDYQPDPSLLHGDLWGGNHAVTANGEPVIFDPAVYYGDREADIAMTELFGGFSEAFYAAYDAVWPRDPGYAMRRDLYNLYHLLNHFNLFAGSYAQQAEQMAKRLLAATR